MTILCIIQMLWLCPNSLFLYWSIFFLWNTCLKESLTVCWICTYRHVWKCDIGEFDCMSNCMEIITCLVRKYRIYHVICVYLWAKQCCFVFRCICVNLNLWICTYRHVWQCDIGEFDCVLNCMEIITCSVCCVWTVLFCIHWQTVLFCIWVYLCDSALMNLHL